MNKEQLIAEIESRIADYKKAGEALPKDADFNRWCKVKVDALIPVLNLVRERRFSRAQFYPDVERDHGDGLLI